MKTISLNIARAIRLCPSCGQTPEVKNLKPQAKCETCSNKIITKCRCCHSVILHAEFNYCPNCGVKIFVTNEF